MSTVIDFAAARRRIQALADSAECIHSIEIRADRIPAAQPIPRAVDASSCAFELEFTPDATLIERFQVMHSYAELGELLNVTLEECR